MSISISAWSNAGRDSPRCAIVSKRLRETVAVMGGRFSVESPIACSSSVAPSSVFPRITANSDRYNFARALSGCSRMNFAEVSSKASNSRSCRSSSHFIASNQGSDGIVLRSAFIRSKAATFCSPTIIRCIFSISAKCWLHLQNLIFFPLPQGQ